MNTQKSYYAQQLDKIDFHGERPPTILVGSDGVVTKTLSLNAECAAALIAKLVEVFVFSPTGPSYHDLEKQKDTDGASGPQKPARWAAKLFISKNGNKTLKVWSMYGGKGFTIQTCGNLPDTHKNGITARTDLELCAYVGRYGTSRQKHILGLI